MHNGEPLPFSSALRAARDGSSEALGQILEGCQGYIAAIVVRQLPRKLHRRIPPSSLVQETYLRACRRFDTFRGTSEPELLAWLRKILLHCLISQLRQPASGMQARELPAQLPGSAATPAEAAADNERAHALEQAIARLPDHYRLVIDLHYFHRLSWAEIGDVLTCSAGAARKLWVRAQAKLGEDLRGFQ